MRVCACTLAKTGDTDGRRIAAVLVGARLVVSSGNLLVRSLVDLVGKDDFVLDSEYLVTVLVVVPKCVNVVRADRHGGRPLGSRPDPFSSTVVGAPWRCGAPGSPTRTGLARTRLASPSLWCLARPGA